MQQVWLIKRKKNLNVQHTFWQISLPLSHEWRSQALSKWQCDRTYSPCSDISGYFLNPQIFLCGFGKNFHVHTCPYSNRICPSTRIRIHSQFLSQFVIKRSSAHAKILSPVCFTDKIVPSSTIFRSFNLFTAFNPSVLHGKKLQIVQPPFGIIEVYSNHSYNEGQTCWDISIKWPLLNI